MTGRRGYVTLAVGLATAMLAQATLATSVTPISKSDWAQNQELPFRWKEGSVPPDWMRAALTGAAADSTRSRGAKAGVLVQRDGSVSWVAYTADIPHSNAIGYASRRVPDSFNVRMRPHGHRFDWGALRWCQFYDSPPDGCFDARMVGLHEFGHVQGLGHIEDAPDPGNWLDSIMHTTARAKPKAGYNARDFGPCDVAALQTRYELLTASTAVSTCLSLATGLTLATSATSVSSTGSVTFTASLNIRADAPYPRLAGDPLSGRVVKLQRRAVGATSWSNHVQMADGPSQGTYRVTLAPGGTYEWRASFVKPSGDGVLASTSGVVKVTVPAYQCFQCLE